MMKKYWIMLVLLLLESPAFCADQWAKTMPASTSLINDLDTLIGTNNEALDRMLSNYRRGAIVQYASASTLSVTAGEVSCSNSGGTVRRFRANTSATTVTWSDIDTGSESSSTTYYVWAVADTDATTFTVTISTSNTAPNSKTYYALLGSFYNDSSSNITLIDSYNESGFGEWVVKTEDVSYQATTDGYFIGIIYYSTGGSAGTIVGYSDGTSSPSTVRAYSGITTNSGNETFYNRGNSFCIPVKKGDYYKGSLLTYYSGQPAPTRTYYFIPTL